MRETKPRTLDIDFACRLRQLPRSTSPSGLVADDEEFRTQRCTVVLGREQQRMELSNEVAISSALSCLESFLTSGTPCVRLDDKDTTRNT